MRWADGIGAVVREIMRIAMDDARVNKETRRMLQPCLDTLENTIEGWCPAALVPTSRGIAPAYGPGQILAGGKHICVATPEQGILVAIDNWKPLSAVLRDDNPDIPQCYAALVHGVRKKDSNLIAATITALRDRDRLRFEDQEKKAAVGGLPVTIALAAVKRHRAGGVLTVLCLPHPLEAQIAMIESEEGVRQ